MMCGQVTNGQRGGTKFTVSLAGRGGSGVSVVGASAIGAAAVPMTFTS